MVRKCCLTCANWTTGNGFDFSEHDIICHIKFDELKKWGNYNIRSMKILLFNAEGMSAKEIRQKLRKMGKNCKYWRQRK